MADLNTRNGPRQHLHILHKHVLGPLSAAETIVERERTEVAGERDAFDEFATRAEGIAPAVEASATLPLGTEPVSPSTQPTSELRRAYRETVMSVSHFDEVYGETIEENASAELGPELAELFQPSSGVSFSAHHRTLLITGATQQARERAAFCDLLESEADSIRSMHQSLTALLETLDTSIVPGWYREQFEERLDEILVDRQSTLYERSIPSSYESRTLCEYLYGDEPWTYPGLTAVARLLDSVVLRDE